MAPRVSVIIPAYNAESTIASAIQSALSQTYAPHEVLVIDDGSSDETATIASGAGPVVACLSTSNGGVSAARNEGIARATGDYVAFLDADDLWLPTKLERQLELLDSAPEVGAAFTALMRVDNDLRTIGINQVRQHRDFVYAFLFGMDVVNNPSCLLVRREAIVSLGGFRHDLSQSADWDLMIRLSQRAQLRVINEPLVLYREHAGNMSRDIHLLEHDVMRVLDAFFADPPEAYKHLEGRCYARHWMILAGSYLHSGDIVEATRCGARAVRLRPSTIGRVVGLPARRMRRLIAK